MSSLMERVEKLEQWKSEVTLLLDNVVDKVFPPKTTPVSEGGGMGTVYIVKPTREEVDGCFAVNHRGEILRYATTENLMTLLEETEAKAVEHLYSHFHITRKDTP